MTEKSAGIENVTPSLAGLGGEDAIEIDAERDGMDRLLGSSGAQLSGGVSRDGDESVWHHDSELFDKSSDEAAAAHVGFPIRRAPDFMPGSVETLAAQFTNDLGSKKREERHMIDVEDIEAREH